jgi:hypothetical protein
MPPGLLPQSRGTGGDGWNRRITVLVYYVGPSWERLRGTALVSSRPLSIAIAAVQVAMTSCKSLSRTHQNEGFRAVNQLIGFTVQLRQHSGQCLLRLWASP